MSTYLTILQTYAKSVPESLPKSVLFKHSSRTITIFDAYPKSIFHFLILPRIQEPKLSAIVLSNLRTLMSGDKNLAKDVVMSLVEEAEAVKKEIQEEMLQRYGFKWEVWTGFHGAPSMEHLHLHVISADLCSEKLKNKKHYNSFHPKLGFFLHTDQVLSWFDADPTFYLNLVKQFKPSNYEAILKENLICFHCEAELKNIPSLKSHLQEHWDKLERRSKESTRRKRKFEESSGSQSASEKAESKAESGTSAKKTKSNS